MLFKFRQAEKDFILCLLEWLSVFVWTLQRLPDTGRITKKSFFKLFTVSISGMVILFFMINPFEEDA